MTIVLTTLFILLIILVIAIRYRLKNAKSTSQLFTAILLLLALIISVYLLGYFKVFQSTPIKDYVVNFKELLQIIILILAVLAFLGASIGFFDKKYTLRIDKFNIGGINVLFDKSSEIYVKTVGTCVSSKRSLFSFNEKRDNIYEVLNAYYDVYNFIRNNLELLDHEKDSDLYKTSVNILKELNKFLTKHQNDYRRWYDKVISDDEFMVSNHEQKAHNTTIEQVQKQYYRYDELLQDIKNLNKYMSEEKIKNMLKINDFIWGEE